MWRKEANNSTCTSTYFPTQLLHLWRSAKITATVVTNTVGCKLVVTWLYIVFYQVKSLVSDLFCSNNLLRWIWDCLQGPSYKRCNGDAYLCCCEDSERLALSWCSGTEQYLMSWKVHFECIFCLNTCTSHKLTNTPPPPLPPVVHASNRSIPLWEWSPSLNPTSCRLWWNQPSRTYS